MLGKSVVAAIIAPIICLALYMVFIGTDFQKAKLFTATALTILVFITCCFYGYRTAELSNMGNAEANVYAYIQLAENAEGGSREEFGYRNAAIMWLVHSNRANDFQQRNCAFTIFWLDIAICMAFAFLFALAEKPTLTLVLIIMALVFLGFFFAFAYDSAFIRGKNINIINPLHYLKLSYLDYSVTHTNGVEDYVKGYFWLEPWLERKNLSMVWQDPRLT
jgi:hypothetical protein